MAHFIRVVKNRKLLSKWKQYLREKKAALSADEYESDSEYSKESKFRRKCWLARVNSRIRTPNTIESVVWESFLGFMGGVLLAYTLFLFFHIGVNISTWASTYTCALTGIILCLGLAFSPNVRCHVLMLLPMFFSKEGRQALLTYALFLSFTGPGRNTMHNMGVLSDSMTCGQEMVRRTLKQITDIMKAPEKSIKETVHRAMKAVQEVEESLRTSIMKIKRLIISVVSVIKMATKWLGSIVNFCNKKIGTPFQRCMKAFDESIADCKAKLGLVDFLCHVVHIMKALCYTVKCLDFICLCTEFVSDTVVGVVRRKLREFHIQTKNLLYVSIEFNHSYKVETTTTNTTKQVGRTILQRLSKKMEKLQTIFSFFGFMFSLLFLFLFVKVYYYRYKYFSSDQFDNFYINSYITDLDKQRARMDRETVLPLEPREKHFYAKPTSLRLLKNEKNRIAESLFLLGLTSFKIITFLVVDYSLFWILMTIYGAGRNALNGVDGRKVVIHVEGKGILADFYRKLGKSLQVPANPNLHLNRLHCLPDPFRPDIGRYIQIGFLVTLCWILTVTEAYGLRLRHIVMSHYYPDRARERAIWLYNHIIRSRGSFIRYARRQLRKKYGGVSPLSEKITLNQRLFADYPLLCSFFGKIRDDNCLVCEEVEEESDFLKRCRTPDCRGRYCPNCFACLNKICTICQHPINYGDVSDISEEIDSSEEDPHEKRCKTSDSELDSDAYESEKFLTFKEMETRDHFRDLEANRLPDYAKLGDLYSDKAALQRRLKAVIQRHLENIERERNRALGKKGTEYQHVRIRLRDVVSKLKNKKVEQKRNKKLEIKQKFSEKIQNLRALKENKSKESKHEIILEECSKPKMSRVSFKSDENEEVPASTSQSNYFRLKNELKAKVESLKKRRNLKCEC